MWDLSSEMGDPAHTPCTGKQSLNQWTRREVTDVYTLLIQCMKWVTRIGSEYLLCRAGNSRPCGDRNGREVQIEDFAVEQKPSTTL